jgi:hypothetical protein
MVVTMMGDCCSTGKYRMHVAASQRLVDELQLPPCTMVSPTTVRASTRKLNVQIVSIKDAQPAVLDWQKAAYARGLFERALSCLPGEASGGNSQPAIAKRTLI